MNLLERYRVLPVPAKAAAWFAVCSAVQSGAAFFAIPFLTRLMSQEQYGLVTLYNSWRQIVIIVATLNIYCGVFNTGMARWKDRRDDYLASMMGLTLLLVAVCTVFLLAAGDAAALFFQLSTPFIVTMMVQVFASAIFSLWSARERFDYRYKALLTYTFVYAAVGQAVSVLAVWLTPDDSNKALVSVASLAAVLLALSIVLVLRTSRKSTDFIDLEFWKHAILFNVPLLPHYLSTLILGQADRIMIASINGASDAAVYGVAYTIGLMIQVVTGALSNALVPWMYERLSGRRIEGVSKKLELVTLGVCAINLAIIVVAPEIMMLAGPESYQNGMYVIPLIAMSMLYTFVYGLFANVELYFEKKLGVVLASGAAAVVNIALNYLMLPLVGYLAAAYVTLLCYALLALGHYIYVSSTLRREGLSGFFDGKRMFACCVAPLPLTAVSVVLFPFPLVRLALLIGLMMCAFVKRDAIAGVFSGLKRS